MIPLIWLSFDGPGRISWDQDIIDIIAPPSEYHHMNPYAPTSTDADVAVVVVPARYNVDHVPEINTFISKFEAVVVILTSDEESLFPWWRLQHRSMKIWVQTPRPDAHAGKGLRFLPLGCPRDKWDEVYESAPNKSTDVFFHGQVNHQRRDDAVEVFQDFPGAYVEPSPGFTQGMPRYMYLRYLQQSKVVLAPSGPSCPDSFRTWEALEAGAVPIVDAGPKPDVLGRAKVGYPLGFWENLLGYVPFPIAKEWSEAPTAAEKILLEYPIWNNDVFAWWQMKKRELRVQLSDDLKEVMHNNPDSGDVAKGGSDITVIIPTSPTPNNPDTTHLFTTIASVRAQLPESEIILMIDGVRKEQEDRRADYEEYVRKVLWMTNFWFHKVTPQRFMLHTHQAEMTRYTLSLVRTPMVLFVEHDTPLMGDIIWYACTGALMHDCLDVIRFYPEEELQPAHTHLFHGRTMGMFLKTTQWSQRPHLTRTDYYRRIIADHFRPFERAMIEDRMHGRVQDEGWDLNRLSIYLPQGGSIKRSGHLDARGNDPKWVDS